MKFGPSSDRAADRQEGIPTMAPRTPVVRDPSHADFPHGTSAGRLRGCTKDYPCPGKPVTCTEARNRKLKQQRLARETGQSPLLSADEQADLKAFVLDLLAAVPLSTEFAVSKAAGIANTTLADVMRSDRPARRTTAAKIRSVTPGRLAQHTRFPAEQVINAARALQLLGYSPEVQERLAGLKGGALPSILLRGPKGTVLPRTAIPLLRLARRIGDRPASDEDGINLIGRRVTAAAARRAGAHPPVCFDANWNLDPRAVEGHAWARADRRAEQRIEVLRHLTDPDRPAGKRIAAAAGCSVRTVDRYAADLGLDRSEPGVSDRDRAKELRPYVFAYDDGDMDPVYLVLSLGLIERINVPSDHPGTVQWDAEQEEKRRKEAEQAHAEIVAALESVARFQAAGRAA